MSAKTVLAMSLQATGQLVAFHTNKRGTAPEQAELEWTPWQESGRDVLNLPLLDWQDSTMLSCEVATDNAAGILEHAPAVKLTFTEMRRDHFRLDLTDLVFARLTCSPGYGIPPAAPGPPRPANRVFDQGLLVDAVGARNQNA